jgi:hypothetical protein
VDYFAIPLNSSGSPARKACSKTKDPGRHGLLCSLGDDSEYCVLACFTMFTLF